MSSDFNFRCGLNKKPEEISGKTQEEVPEEAPHQLRLLCLDGGGVRGLSSLYILLQLMTAIEPANPPKPCEVFDLIGGTGTGGLVFLFEISEPS